MLDLAWLVDRFSLLLSVSGSESSVASSHGPLGSRREGPASELASADGTNGASGLDANASGASDRIGKRGTLESGLTTFRSVQRRGTSCRATLRPLA